MKLHLSSLFALSLLAVSSIAVAIEPSTHATDKGLGLSTTQNARTNERRAYSYEPSVVAQPRVIAQPSVAAQPMTQERRTFTYTPVSQSYVVPSYREFRAGVHAYENGANKALGRGY